MTFSEFVLFMMKTEWRIAKHIVTEVIGIYFQFGNITWYLVFGHHTVELRVPIAQIPNWSSRKV